MSKPSNKRKSLTELFPQLNIESTSSTSSNRPRDETPLAKINMRKSLRGTIARGWPPKKPVPEYVSMTIRADGIYRQYSDDQNPEELMKKAIQWLTMIENSDLGIDQKADIVGKEIEDSMVRAIFGSNFIEHAGLGLDITVQLCKRVFDGDDVEDVEERSESYQDELIEFYRKVQPDLRDKSAKFIIRGRHEIVQHAKAFKFFIHEFVNEGRDLSEELLCETHRILTDGVPLSVPDGAEVPSSVYGGKYRTVIVGAGTTNFTVPKFIPSQMRRLCEDAKAEMDSAEANGVIDPFSLAAKFSMQFVQIHPFQDGNGRMCRMILSGILCRYAGIIIPVGEQGDSERSEYIGIKTRASEQAEDHGEYAVFVLKKSLPRIRELKKKLAGKKAK